MRRALRSALLGLTALAAPAHGYDVVGPNKCTNCHDHDPQKDWYYKGEGNKGHRKSLEQLEEPKGKEYAKKLGVPEDAVYSPKGRCVVCHATVVKGKDPEIGVSCETCHGAGSGYLEPHKEKNSYKQAVSLGMFDTRVKERKSGLSDTTSTMPDETPLGIRSSGRGTVRVKTTRRPSAATPSTRPT